MDYVRTTQQATADQREGVPDPTPYEVAHLHEPLCREAHGTKEAHRLIIAQMVEKQRAKDGVNFGKWGFENVMFKEAYRGSAPLRLLAGIVERRCAEVATLQFEWDPPVLRYFGEGYCDVAAAAGYVQDSESPPSCLFGESLQLRPEPPCRARESVDSPETPERLGVSCPIEARLVHDLGPPIPRP